MASFNRSHRTWRKGALVLASTAFFVATTAAMPLGQATFGQDDGAAGGARGGSPRSGAAGSQRNPFQGRLGGRAPQPQDATGETSANPVVPFQLSYAEAGEAARLLSEVYAAQIAAGGVTIAPVPAINSIMVTAPPEIRTSIGKLIETIDVAAPRTVAEEQVKRPQVAARIIDLPDASPDLTRNVFNALRALSPLLASSDAGSSLRWGVDDVNGKIIVLGTAEQTVLAQDFVNQLVSLVNSDAKQAAPEIKILEIRNMMANDVVQLLKGISKDAPPGTPKFSVSEEMVTNTIAVTGSPEAVATAEAIVQRLDEQAAPQPIDVRVVWLVDGGEAAPDKVEIGSPELPPGLESAEEAIAKVGVKNPRFLGQAVTGALGNQQFTIQSVANLGDEDVGLIVHGQVRLSGDTVTMRMRVEATTPADVESENLKPRFLAETTVSTLVGRSVVGGGAPPDIWADR